MRAPAPKAKEKPNKKKVKAGEIQVPGNLPSGGAVKLMVAAKATRPLLANAVDAAMQSGIPRPWKKAGSFGLGKKIIKGLAKRGLKPEDAASAVGTAVRGVKEKLKNRKTEKGTAKSVKVSKKYST